VNKQIILDDSVITRSVENYTFSKTKVEIKRINTQRISLSMNNLSVYNFKHFDGIVHDIDFTQIHSNGLTHSDGRFYSMEPTEEIQTSISSKINDIINYIKSNWFMFKIILITIGSILISLIILIFIISIYRKCRTIQLKQVNLIEGFLPTQSKQVNKITRQTSDISLDDVTKSFLEKIEIQKREKILKKYNK
jgi:hypothetical protein